MRVKSARARRDDTIVRTCLAGLLDAARRGDNTFPHILNAVRAEATVGEVCECLKPVYGEYREVPVF